MVNLMEFVGDLDKRGFCGLIGQKPNWNRMEDENGVAAREGHSYEEFAIRRGKKILVGHTESWEGFTF